MNEKIEQNKRDVTQFISEAVEQLVNRAQRSVLDEVLENLNRRWNAINYIINTSVGEQLYEHSTGSRSQRIYMLRRALINKMIMISNIVGEIMTIRKELIK